MNFIAVGRDFSDYKAREAELARAQELLRQSQKMEAVGQLTGAWRMTSTISSRGSAAVSKWFRCAWRRAASVMSIAT